MSKTPTTASPAPPLSEERLRAIAAEAWTLEPVPSYERKNLLLHWELGERD